MVWWESVSRGSNVFSRTTWLPLGLQGWRQGRLWLECVYILKCLHQGDCEWLTPCPLGRHSGAMRSFPWWPEPALPLPFPSKVWLLVFATTKERPFNPPYKSVPLSLLYHPIKKRHQTNLNFGDFYKHGNNFCVLIILYSLKTLSICENWPARPFQS